MRTREARIRWKEGAPQGGGRNVWQPRETRWLISVKTNPRPAIRHPRPSLRALNTRICFVNGIRIGRSKHASTHTYAYVFCVERKSVCGPWKLGRFPRANFSLTNPNRTFIMVSLDNWSLIERMESIALRAFYKNSPTSSCVFFFFFLFFTRRYLDLPNSSSWLSFG